MTGSESLPGRHALVTGALSGVRLVNRTTGSMDQPVAAIRDSVGVARSVVLAENDIRITTLMSGVAGESLLGKVPATALMAMDKPLRPTRIHRRCGRRRRRAPTASEHPELVVRPAQTATFFS